MGETAQVVRKTLCASVVTINHGVLRHPLPFFNSCDDDTCGLYFSTAWPESDRHVKSRGRGRKGGSKFGPSEHKISVNEPIFSLRKDEKRSLIRLYSSHYFDFSGVMGCFFARREDAKWPESRFSRCQLLGSMGLFANSAGVSEYMVDLRSVRPIMLWMKQQPSGRRTYMSETPRGFCLAPTSCVLSAIPLSLPPSSPSSRGLFVNGLTKCVMFTGRSLFANWIVYPIMLSCSCC